MAGSGEVILATLLCGGRVVRLAADQSDAVAVGVGEHGDAAGRCVGRGQDTGAPELLGAGEGAVHVIDTVFSSFPPPTSTLAPIVSVPAPLESL